MVEEVIVTCTLCGKVLNTVEVAHECHPKVFYWWPREHPYTLALIAVVIGFVLGVLL